MDFLVSIGQWFLDCFTNLLAFLKFIFDIPGTFVVIVATFPPFIRIGILVVLGMLVTCLIVRVKNYVS